MLAWTIITRTPSVASIPGHLHNLKLDLFVIDLHNSPRWTPFTSIASPLAVSKRYFSSVSYILQCATMFGLTIV
ncbi:hypothetical protein NQ315_000748 [Exocentrus adspersus]|uniref:Uncharacterized protein n=1 Tax=Exocentrus adspersus TaxID=1586481 RepID=A0AAV8WDM6_9CUCU|nr:hypothetical protein NQ315_000748 [Exocentrus adspersus]